ncbi:MAG TPA: hypothetical protein VNQ80_03360 [Parapedobacter sp.]|uniref:hypothetical protein n=1 Tax=Parapedobacter sp. TaxID=1958893 RepID=UPI002CD87FC9|nr:hypothetical protein [Parapedobacter sp.]HWK56346.1 hypothetical protein [Parapedobacter sp.]
MLALAAMFVGFSAFKYAERFDDPQDGWYLVTPSSSDPDNESLQTIGSSTIPEPDETNAEACAQFDNEGNVCAIKLTFHTDENDEYPPMPTTVQQAENEDLIDVDGRSRLPEPEETF